VAVNGSFKEAIVEMTGKKMAAVSVVDGGGRLVGFFSTGDLGRVLAHGALELEAPISRFMTPSPKFATPDMMAVKALEILREHKIIQLPVCDEEHRVIGMIHTHDITRAGIA
jgi:arabinose-5-phosphate isomerase